MPKAFLFSFAIYYNWLVSQILSTGEIILLCSRCDEKGLVYITIASPIGRQPLSYAKCTKANMRFSCDVHSTSNVKCVLLISLCNLLVLYLIYCKVLYLDSR